MRGYVMRVCYERVCYERVVTSTGASRNAYGRPRRRNDTMAFQNTTARCVVAERNSLDNKRGMKG